MLWGRCFSSPVSAGGHKARPYTAYNDNITTFNAFVLIQTHHIIYTPASLKGPEAPLSAVLQNTDAALLLHLYPPQGQLHRPFPRCTHFHLLSLRHARTG